MDHCGLNGFPSHRVVIIRCVGLFEREKTKDRDHDENVGYYSMYSSLRRLHLFGIFTGTLISCHFQDKMAGTLPSKACYSELRQHLVSLLYCTRPVEILKRDFLHSGTHNAPTIFLQTSLAASHIPLAWTEFQASSALFSDKELREHQKQSKRNWSVPDVRYLFTWLSSRNTQTLPDIIISPWLAALSGVIGIG